MSQPTSHSSTSDRSIDGPVPYIRLGTETAHHLWPTSPINWFLGFALFFAIAVGASLKLWLEPEHPLLQPPAKTALVLVIAAVLALQPFRIGKLLDQRAALRAARASSTPEARIAARVRIAQAFGRRGRSSLARWVNRRGHPPLICIGLRPDPHAFAEVDVDQEREIYRNSRPFAVQRAFDQECITSVMENYVIFLILYTTCCKLSSTDDLSNPTVVTVIACMVILLGVFYIRNGTQRTGSVFGLRKILGMKLCARSDSIEFIGLRNRTAFDPQNGVMILLPRDRPSEFNKFQDPLTMGIRVRLISSSGDQHILRLTGADNPSIADLGARWLHGWGLPRAPQPTQLGTLPQ